MNRLNTGLWLGRAQEIEGLILQLQEARANAKRHLYNFSPQFSSDRVQVSKQNSFEEHMALYLSYDEKLREELVRLYIVQTEILDKIREVEDELLSSILVAHYINGKTFSQIAEQLHYSTRQIVRLHQKALQYMEDVIECHGGL